MKNSSFFFKRRAFNFSKTTFDIIPYLFFPKNLNEAPIFLIKKKGKKKKKKLTKQVIFVFNKMSGN